jgi:hypothetical protein
MTYDDKDFLIKWDTENIWCILIIIILNIVLKSLDKIEWMDKI